MRIQLIYIDPITSSQRQPILETPIALGSDFNVMPAVLDDRRVTRLTLNHVQIASYHALIDVFDDQVMVMDQNSPAGIRVNGVRQNSASLKNGDRVQIGPCEIHIQLVPRTVTPAPVDRPRAVLSAPAPAGAGCNKQIGFLFPRRCGRTTTAGCPHCNGGQIRQDPYFYYPEHSFYVGYGDYSAGQWGSDYLLSTGSSIDFTEADAASLESMDTDFEQDMGAS